MEQLAVWFDASKVLFKMGSIPLEDDAACLMGILTDFNRKVDMANTEETKNIAIQNRKEFLDDLEKELPLYSALRKRFVPELYKNIQISEDVKLYISLIAMSTGAAMMAMTYLYLARCYSLKDMCLNFMPSGFPIRDALGLTWALQKSGSANLIDDLESVNNLYNKMYNNGDK